MFNIEISNHELDEAVRRAAAGEEVTLTRQGQVVARLVPMRRTDREQVKAAVTELLEFRKGRSLGGLSIKELKEEGRL